MDAPPDGAEWFEGEEEEFFEGDEEEEWIEGEEEEFFVTPAVQGTENVLSACVAEGVSRVVVTFGICLSE